MFQLFVAAVGDDCTPADEELQQETAKSFSIEVLKKKTAGLKKAAVDNYPDGKKVTEEGKKPEEEKKPEEKSGKDTPLSNRCVIQFSTQIAKENDNEYST